MPIRRTLKSRIFCRDRVRSCEFLVVINVYVYRLEIFFVGRNDLLLLHFPKLVDLVLLQ